MSMTEAPTTAPAKPKRHARSNRRKPVAPAVPKTSEMAGITISDCPTGCRPDRCIISLKGICAHPGKGGLQAPLQTPETLRRFNEARRVLGKQKLDLTGL